MPATVLAALAGNAISNATSEWHANKQFNREKQLMNMQNDMNRANALDAYSQQVQGAKMAGLSPALLNGQTPQVAAPVTKGSVGMGENVEIDPATLLMDAQRKNIEADTAKKQAEVGNVEADTSKKTAEKLFTDAGTKKVEEETQNIKNINQTYADTNANLNPMGQALAQKWQSTEWYNKLNPQSKDWIDSVASGNEKLTVGGMQALHTIVNSQKEISDSDRTLVKNAFDNAISEAMYNDEEVMKALAKAPQNEQNKIKEEINKLIADTALSNKTKEDLENRIKSFIESDLGFLANQGQWGKYMREVLVQKLVTPLAYGLSSGGILGMVSKFLGKGGKSTKSGMDTFDKRIEHGKKVRDAEKTVPPYKEGFPNGPYNDYGPYNFGVENMKWNHYK